MENQPEQHEMVLMTTHDSGAEEWYCPTCGRRFLMQWSPNYDKIVLEQGDIHATHGGGKSGLSIQVSSGRVNEEIDPANDLNLSIWENLLDQAGFESWWLKDIE